MSKLFAMCAPILSGKEGAWQEFMKELAGKQNSGFKESRKKLKVRERTFHQATPAGEMVLVTLEGENPEAAFAGFGNGNDEFTKWFVSRVKDIHGFDLSAPPQSPMPALVIDSEA
jgi:hypothetical protein